MTADPHPILEDLRRDVGRATPWRRYAVTAVDAERFRMALHPERRGPLPVEAGPGPVPPTAWCPDPIILAQRLGLTVRLPFPNTLDGGTRWVWEAPLAAGDRLWLRAEIEGVAAKQGAARTGLMILTTILVTCAGDDGSVLARSWGTWISYEGEGG